MSTPLSMSDRLAQRLALAVPALLLAGAYISEYGFDLFPCEMCWWQRWPHFAAIGLAFLSTVLPAKRFWIAAAAGGILTSGLIGAFHAGVEWSWWEGITGCAGAEPGNFMSMDVVRCDVAAWRFLGISLAGWNALLSIGSAIAIWVLLAAKEKVR